MREILTMALYYISLSVLSYQYWMRGSSPTFGWLIAFYVIMASVVFGYLLHRKGNWVLAANNLFIGIIEYICLFIVLFVFLIQFPENKYIAWTGLMAVTLNIFLLSPSRRRVAAAKIEFDDQKRAGARQH